MPEAISLHRDDNTYSRRIGGKTRFFGKLRGEKYRNQYDEILNAVETLQSNKTVLQADKNLTELGKQNAFLDDTKPLLKEGLRFAMKSQKAKANLQDKAAKTYAKTLKDWNLDGGLHSRLIQTWKDMKASDRAALLGSDDFVKKNPELAKAVLAEPRIVTGIDEESATKLRHALLDDDQRETLTAIDEELHDIEVMERAYGEARHSIADMAEITPNMVTELENDMEVTVEDEDNDDEDEFLVIPFKHTETT